MLILIEKDSATRVPREVPDVAAARVFADQGFHVVAVVDGTKMSLDDYAAKDTPVGAMRPDGLLQV